MTITVITVYPGTRLHAKREGPGHPLVHDRSLDMGRLANVPSWGSIVPFSGFGLRITHPFGPLESELEVPQESPA
jgi:hypothetical protein